MLPKPYYEHGGITIYHAKAEDVLPALPPVDVVVTDIPYNISQQSNGLRRLDYGDWDHNADVMPNIEAALRLCSGAMYVWCGNEQLSGLLGLFKRNGLIERALSWVKENPTVLNGDKVWLPAFELCAFGKRPSTQFNFFCRAGVWHASPDYDRLHPNQKPLRIIKDQILASSVNGETVLDPYMGSGTTLRAAKDLGRRAIGIEIEERYCEIAAQRLSQQAFDLGDIACKPKNAQHAKQENLL